MEGELLEIVGASPAADHDPIIDYFDLQSLYSPRGSLHDAMFDGLFQHCGPGLAAWFCAQGSIQRLLRLVDIGIQGYLPSGFPAAWRKSRILRRR